jgi:6-phosphogluconolactonase
MIKVFPDIEELNRFAAEKFIEIANDSINSTIGNFTVALSGGSTPKALYRLLASDEFKNSVEWKKVFFFFGDERHVLPDDEQSNFRMVNENLFQPLKISPKNIFRWITEEKFPDVVAIDYDLTIWEFFEKKEGLIIDSDEKPAFDLILLGMGADGHTASLFPYTIALNLTEELAFNNPVEKLKATRLTMTFPVINNAKNVIFLVAGAEKAEALREVLEGEFQPDKFPAQNVKLNDGNLLWLVDQESARLLK